MKIGIIGFGRMGQRRAESLVGAELVAVAEFPGPDDSFAVEMREFMRDIRTGRSPVPGLTDAIRALRVVERIKG